VDQNHANFGKQSNNFSQKAASIPILFATVEKKILK
jgi:hypothetical protein